MSRHNRERRAKGRDKRQERNRLLQVFSDAGDRDEFIRAERIQQLKVAAERAAAYARRYPKAPTYRQ
jgi:hypothetical protein